MRLGLCGWGLGIRIRVMFRVEHVAILTEMYISYGLGLGLVHHCRLWYTMSVCSGKTDVLPGGCYKSRRASSK